MDILKREIAPISQEAWSEIDDTAKEVLTKVLSGRKALKINGPKGWDYSAVVEGRLEELDRASDNKNVGTGVYKVKPLVEARVSFELNKWELDNIQRGAKDIDFTNLELACEDLALFEENLLYNGYKNGDIEGLCEVAGHRLKLGKEGNDILNAIGEGKYTLFSSYGEMPFDLIVSTEVYNRLNVVFEGAHLIKIVEDLIGGEIIRSKVIKGALLLPHKSDDIEFTIGQDLSIGYERELDSTVQLFVTESLMLRVLDENKLVVFEEK
ncbi:MAG: family 1 encapsulin nanocompartment shell protein [Andreesenia angusta]|nr:family 1 encapsulin nanocompartment shell protein [Andreesenia angusta]